MMLRCFVHIKASLSPVGKLNVDVAASYLLQPHASTPSELRPQHGFNVMADNTTKQALHSSVINTLVSLMKSICYPRRAFLLSVVLFTFSDHTFETIKIMSSVLLSALTGLQQNDYLTRMLILPFARSIS